MKLKGMMDKRGSSRLGLVAAALSAVLMFPHCSGPDDAPGDNTEAGAAGAAGAGAVGGSSDAGAPNGGSPTAGGGSAGDGGVSAGGGPIGSGGASGGAGGVVTTGGSGGQAQGGSAASGGDVGSSGAASAGAGAGAGGASGGVGNETAGAGGGEEAGAGGLGGAGGEPNLPRPDFILGADISSLQEEIDLGATFVDTDGIAKPIVELLAAHGFNYIRLRTFVDPANLYGYANPNGNPQYVRAQPYCDRDHTASFGKQMKDAGMGLLVDLHYSDNWADPGKQIIPERWRDTTSIEALGESVKSYTSDVIQHLVDAGARPDIVQIGNEIAPGMMFHVPASVPNADQWGNMNMVVNPIGGSTSNWANLGLLLKKGIEGVHAVDPNIRIMLHLANTQNAGGVLDWVTNAKNNGVDFDILGVSCYTSWHGQPAIWENTLKLVARNHPDLDFVIAEYGPEARRANEIIRELPARRGLGTFVWEPTQSGTWGPSMFSFNASSEVYTALPAPFAIYDGIRDDFGIE